MAIIEDDFDLSEEFLRLSIPVLSDSRILAGPAAPSMWRGISLSFAAFLVSCGTPMVVVDALKGYRPLLPTENRSPILALLRPVLSSYLNSDAEEILATVGHDMHHSADALQDALHCEDDSEPSVDHVNMYECLRRLTLRMDNRMTGNTISDSAPFVTSYTLNRKYDFVRVIDGSTNHGTPHTSEIYVACNHLGDAARSFRFFKKEHLKSFLLFHGIAIRNFVNKTVLELILALLEAQQSSSSAQSPILVFKERSRPRPLSGTDMRLLIMHDLQNQLVSVRQRRTASSTVRARRVLPSLRSRITPRHCQSDNTTLPFEIPTDELSCFPYTLTDEHRRSIIRKWQQHGSDMYREKPCAVCGMAVSESMIHVLHADNIDLHLLNNPVITNSPDLIPTSYNFHLYDNAILYHAGLVSPYVRGYMNVCTPCQKALLNGRQPEDSWANHQYYAHECLPPDVVNTIDRMSDFDRMMVCRARASKITHTYNEKRGVYEEEGTSRGYSAGNVAVLPQDTAVLRNTLPPNRLEIENSICAIFVNHSTPSVTRDNISRNHPVLVSKNNVKTMLDFLCANNPAYSSQSGLVFSNENLLELHDNSDECGVPTSVEVHALSECNPLQPSNPINFDNEDFLMDTVGYTMGDFSHNSHKYMKAVALDHCLKGRKFVQVRTGSAFTDDDSFWFLTSAFPHLDPWGIGGFNNPDRTVKQKISFERQLKNMLRQHNRTFIEDSNFAYVCWNILQKRETRQCIAFKTSERRRRRVTEQLPLIQPGLESMILKWKRSPWASPETDVEKRAVKLLSMIRMLPKNLKGSAAYKQCRRNEIRSLLKKYGTPALFITLTPDDKTNEIIGALAGVEDEEWWRMTELDRKRFIAKHPDLAARAFDITMRKFVDIVLKPKDGPGAFGTCNAYYGMVEAQGRGMLHCHFLIWLAGNPNPQRLRKLMKDNECFRQDIFRWLEETIKCQLPGDVDVVQEPDGPLSRPVTNARSVDVRFEKPPLIDELSPSDFDSAYVDQLKRLVIEYNWHEHRDTCWKHLLPGDPRDDTTCRMRMNGQTNEQSYVDDETGSIMLKRLHPRISNYNELLTFLLRSNTDIKYVGSGEAAKALVYYVTDYITKSELPMHSGLAAIQVAMERTENQYRDTNASSDSRGRSLLIKSLNAIMARTELSHQQVMSYLVGGGDAYRSHSFDTFVWNDVEQYLDLRDDGMSCGIQPEISSDEMLNIEVDAENTVSVSNEVRDYVLRDHKESFEKLTLYDYIAKAYKMKDVRYATMELPQASVDNIGRFIERHPQKETHIVRIRSTSHVPVILGRRFPRPDQGEEKKEEWCRSMLVLFKPWRKKADLKNENETWSQSFNRMQFQPEHINIMLNMHVENECKDARDAHSADYRRQRRSFVRGVGGIETRFIGDIMRENDESVSYERNELVNDEDGEPTYLDDVHEEFDSELCQIISESGVLDCEGLHEVDQSVHLSESRISERDVNVLHAHQIVMDKYRKEKRPASGVDTANKRRRLNNGNALPVTSVEQMSNGSIIQHHTIPPRRLTRKSDMKNIINSIIHDFTMEDNEEQQRAFRIVADHFISGTEDQLLMYVSGVGGTGKSHVIDAIVKFFEECGYSDRLLVSAPTGCAAVLINGYTIHALTFLPSGKARVNHEDLEYVWRNIRYLIIDEVSMISAYFLGQISERITSAKASVGGSDKPLGGINVIFFGDLGQLPPVGSLPLFSRELVEALRPNIKETYRGQVALQGALIWRQIRKSVMLKKNRRAAEDPEFANLLSRIRRGIAWDGRSEMTELQRGTGENYAEPDEVTLRRRDLRTVLRSDDGAVKKFKDAPVIVGRKIERDRINAMKVHQYAAIIRKDVHQYYAQDYCRRVPLEGEVQQRVWDMPSSRTSDALGKLPLVPGMKVMITENVAMMAQVVNGTEGTLLDIKWDVDDHGRRFAKCAYIKIEGSNVKIPGLQRKVVPIFPVKTYFKFKGQKGEYPITREQLPIVPAYSLTDYKCQGRTLDAAIIDISDCRSLQNVYVMLSRCRSLRDVAIIRPFPSVKIHARLSQEFRLEFSRLQGVDRRTKEYYEKMRESADVENDDVFTG